jgi:hypothetical protein
MKRRRRARENPTPLIWAAYALGAAVVGGVAYVALKPKAAAAAPAAAPLSVTTQAPAPTNGCPAGQNLFVVGCLDRVPPNPGYFMTLPGTLLPWTEMDLQQGGTYSLPSGVRVAITVSNPTAAFLAEVPELVNMAATQPSAITAQGMDPTTLKVFYPNSPIPVDWPVDGRDPTAFRMAFETVGPVAPSNVLPGQLLWTAT